MSAQPQALTSENSSIVIRRASPADAETCGRICFDERTPIAGLGPITIDPVTQNRNAGRRLMQAVLERAEERKFAGVRLVQAAYHSRSLSLYAKLGFVVRSEE